jgi:hypothetical protein
MKSQRLTPSVKQCFQVAIATLLVAGCPLAIVWWLRASGTISTAALGVPVGLALSLCASCVGCLVWKKQPGSEDLLFSELMIWGFLHRWHTRRRLASALDMLGPVNDPRRLAVDGLSRRRQAQLLEQLVAEMETRDPYLHGHSRRVARHSWMIAKRMGLPRAEVARIRTAAAIHDVGKIETPKAILHKAGPLTDEEYEVIKRHPGDGALMAAVLGDPELTSIVRHHHERLDGTGYPSGLTRAEIPIGARIVAVADTFDAITSARPYRAASPHKRALDILNDEAGIRLDPAVVRAFCAHYAGRRPLALWGFVAGLPERVVSSLGGSVATVASATKVVGVAALVSGAAATTPTLALPLGKPHANERHQVGRAALHAPSDHSTPGSSIGPSVDPVPPTVEPSPHRGPPGPQPATAPAGGTASAEMSASGAPVADSGQIAGPGQPQPLGQPAPSGEKGTPGEKGPPRETGPPGEMEPPGETEPPVESGPPGETPPPDDTEPPG